MPIRSPLLIAAVAVLATACSQQDKKPRLPEAAVLGVWTSDTLPAADAGGRIYRLEMLSGGTAEFTTEFLGKGTVTQRGTWDGADSLVRIVVRGGATASRPTSLLLAIRREELGLVQFDSTEWGPSGLTLTRLASR